MFQSNVPLQAIGIRLLWLSKEKVQKVLQVLIDEYVQYNSALFLTSMTTRNGLDI